MSNGSYPRDMVGYGRQRPDPKWPGGARIGDCLARADIEDQGLLPDR